MEDRLRSRSPLDRSFPNSNFDSKGDKSSILEFGRESKLIPKGVKMLQSFFRSEDQSHLGEKDEISQITIEPKTTISDAVQCKRTDRNTLPFFGDASSLRSACVDSAPNTLNFSTGACISKNIVHDATAPAHVNDTREQFVFDKHDKNGDPKFVTSRGIGLDLNICLSSSLDQDPFCLDKIHSHVNYVDASECGSSTDPPEENASLRTWNEMKRNGFLSSSHGGIPVPKQRIRKSKSDMLKRNMELAKREQINRFTKIAAPSGLLNELNPGIINHVRNSKQVHSIIEALVRSEKLENRGIQSKEGSQIRKGIKDINGRKDHGNGHYSWASRPIISKEEESPHTLSGNRPTRGCYMSSNICKPTSSKYKGEADESHIIGRRVSGETSDASQSTSDHKDDTLMLKLSSARMESENTSSLSNKETLNKANVSSLSVKAATVASQWLELLLLDIRGRLAALRRSKKRVRAVIQTELPFLMSKEFPSNPENNPNSTHSLTSGHPNIATPEMHRARWTGLFDQMDKALFEEGKHLERWLNQVEEMQWHCEHGLQCVNWNAAHDLQHLSISEIDSRLKRADNSEGELAIRAAAASIYSTCNFAMSADSKSCL